MTTQKGSATRRRFIGTVASVALGAAGAGMLTNAAFSDTEASAGNAIESGTLDLTVDGGNRTVKFLAEANISPGDSGTATLSVANAGSVGGYLDVTVASLTTYENACVGNEGSKDGTCGDPGEGIGEAQDALEVGARFRNGPELWSGWDTVANRLAAGTVYDLDYELTAGASDVFELDWRLPSSPGRDVKSDAVTVALTFGLDQGPDSGA